MDGSVPQKLQNDNKIETPCSDRIYRKNYNYTYKLMQHDVQI